MMKKLMVAICLATSWTNEASAQTTADTCKLTQDVPTKPMPSLTQCYRFNTNSCCVSGQDAVIKDEFESTLSANCLRQVPLLEHWFCLGCDPDGMKYLNESDPQNPVIRVCQSFAAGIFNSSLNTCGIFMEVENPLQTEANPIARWEKGYHTFTRGGEKQVILPDIVYNSSKAFLNDLLPPYFKDYKVEIVEDGDDCFSNGTKQSVSLITLIISLHFARRLVFS